MKTTRFALLLLSALALSACGAGVVNPGAADDAALGADLTANSRFEAFQGADGQYYFHLLAGNGQKVLASQGYASASGALSGLQSVKTNGVNGLRYQVRTAADGSPYFVLKAGNGHVIAVSQLYSASTDISVTISKVIDVVTAASTSAVAPLTGTRFETFRGLDGKYYFDLRAANGEIVLQSQAYASKSSATNGMSSVKTNGANAARYEQRSAADGQSYFVLKAANGQVIAMSEMYASASDAQRGEQGVIGLLTVAK